MAVAYAWLDVGRGKTCKTQDKVMKHGPLTPPEFNSQCPSTPKLHRVILIKTDTPPVVPLLPLECISCSQRVGTEQNRTEQKKLFVHNKNANSVPQSPTLHAPYAIMKQAPNFSQCSIMCIFNDLLDVILRGWSTLQRWQRTHKNPRSLLASAGCIRGISRGNHDSADEN